MRKIIDFIKRDLRHIRGNVIALVVIMGIIVVPTFYAWFNIGGFWDPYSNTKNLKVAVANSDLGYTSDLMPIEVNFGDRVVNDLRESTAIGYTVVSEDEAIEGVRSGEYYAAVVIPEDFSADLLTALSDNPVKAQVKFYQNEKANAIAQIVTNKASSAIEKDIDESFASTVTTVGAGVLDQLGSYLDDDKIAEVAANLDTAVQKSSETLTSTAQTMRGFADTLDATQGLLGSGSSAFDASLSSTLSVGNSLTGAASNVRDLGNALDGTTGSINDAIASSSASIGAVSDAIDSAFDAADAPTNDLIDALTKAQGVASTNQERLNDLASRLSAAADKMDAAKSSVDAQLNALDPNSPLYAIRYSTLHKTSIALQDARDSARELKAHAESAASSMDELSQMLGKTAGDIQTGKTDAAAARAELQGIVSNAKDSLSSVESFYETNLKGSLNDLANNIDSAAGDADSIMSSLNETLGAVGSTASSAADSIGGASDSLSQAADVLDDSAQKLVALHGKLTAALESDDMNQVRSILSGDVNDLANFISKPVVVDRNPIYAIENNGSAMAPFYTTLAIWIGGVVLAALVKTGASEKAIEETGCSHTQVYLGRLALFAGVGLLQSALICAGDLYFLGVQCANPALFFLVGWLASFVFVNIIYALTASFGDVGKAIAVVLMVIQVAGSGGTFPKEMLPATFQALYPFLPFVHSENAMRAAMFGLYGNDFWVCMGKLACFLVLALLLGLVLRRPIIRLNEWVEEKLESTKVM